MKKLLLAVFILFFSISLSACQKVEPIENPEPELFSVFHEKENFTLLIRTDIDSDQAYTSVGYTIYDKNGDTCLVGSAQISNYLVLYKEKYYNIQTGSQLGLFNADDLIDWGISVNCDIKE